MKARIPQGAGGAGNMNQMMQRMQKMQEEMTRAQAEVGINGKKEVTSVTLKPEVVDPDDIEFLQDLIREGVNEAIRACNADAEQTIGAITGGLDLGL